MTCVELGQSLGLPHRLRGQLGTEGTDEWRTLCYSATAVYEGVGFQLSHAPRMYPGMVTCTVANECPSPVQQNTSQRCSPHS
jgi:hypothetical protein